MLRPQVFKAARAMAPSLILLEDADQVGEWVGGRWQVLGLRKALLANSAAWMHSS